MCLSKPSFLQPHICCKSHKKTVCAGAHFFFLEKPCLKKAMATHVFLVIFFGSMCFWEWISAFFLTGTCVILLVFIWKGKKMHKKCTSRRRKKKRKSVEKTVQAEMGPILRGCQRPKKILKKSKKCKHLLLFEH